MKKKLLISDIAKQLNISITTVSFILNGKAKEKRISDSLTARVLKLVEEVNYKPNQLAQSLRTGKTKTIGLMVEDISNTFFANIARLIEEKAYKAGYKIIYCSTEDDTAKTRDLISMFRDKHVDGYIITPPPGVEEDIKELIAEGLPVVLLDRTLPGLPTNFVGVDNRMGSYSATEHLIGQGYKKIALVTTESGQSQMLQRLEGYEQAMAHHQLAPKLLKIPFRVTTEDMIPKIMAFLDDLRQRDDLDAVLFATNYLALRGLEAIDKLELRVPADVGVVGFDDHDIFRLYKPSVTAVAQPTEAIADQVINMMLDQLDTDDRKQATTTQTAVLPTSLIVRNSTTRR
ncbi:substrate-binding domain-containing protein [Pontibacter sp. E15-1]|uniref:LacI family DNA-binding transcriptional regulator n=1 Tax=Pontibacter sp. E15-1 TaxID=2919918 RepID=UPI001F4F60D6|nr:substrate-binding domain-containing protein [Pontibacter sp. E15-1]MCJ8164379.1 substrate-binding domain-containing protein [Pontibacter sp. E15-1]